MESAKRKRKLDIFHFHKIEHNRNELNKPSSNKFDRRKVKPTQFFVEMILNLLYKLSNTKYKKKFNKHKSKVHRIQKRKYKKNKK